MQIPRGVPEGCSRGAGEQASSDSGGSDSFVPTVCWTPKSEERTAGKQRGTNVSAPRLTPISTASANWNCRQFASQEPR